VLFPFFKYFNGQVSFKQLGKHIAAGAGFISNLVLWQEVGYFDNSAETKPLLHLWSLSIEEQFYLAWPFAAWIAWAALKTRKQALLVLACIAATVSFLLNLRGVATHPSSTFFYPHTRAWELLSGSILAWILLYKNSSHIGAQTPIYLGGFKPVLTQSKCVSRF
jgi:peptidoglycan/LPS O-acetylase OafA/YrhL